MSVTLLWVLELAELILCPNGLDLAKNVEWNRFVPKLVPLLRRYWVKCWNGAATV